MALITSRLTPKRVPGALLICRSKLNFTSSAVSSPKPLWNCTPFRSLNVQIVPSGESVQLSARSGSTSDVVTLPSLMAKRVSPRNMNREMACDCPSVLECGSSVSGSLAAMLRIFFRCASAGAGASAASNARTARPPTNHLDMAFPFSRRSRAFDWREPAGRSHDFRVQRSVRIVGGLTSCNSGPGLRGLKDDFAGAGAGGHDAVGLDGFAQGQHAVDEDAVLSFGRSLEREREVVGGDAARRADDGDGVQVERLHVEGDGAVGVGAGGDEP